MKTALLFTAALVGLGLVQPASAAGVPTLADWCFNVNGDVADLCNGGTSPTLTGTVNGVGVSGGMDLTLAGLDPLNPVTNILGSASFVLGPGANQFVSVYMDYDLNYANQGSNSDFASVIGALPAGYAYQIDDPNSSNILCGVSCFGDFGANTLQNTNNVGIFADTSNNNPCCDVSWALGVTVSVSTGYQDTITFLASTTAPTSGFYLQQTNGFDSSQTIFLSASIDEVQTGPSTPEPGTWFLLSGGLIGIIALRIRVRQNASV